MSFLRKSIMAGAAFWAIHALRQKRNEVKAEPTYTKDNDRPFNDNTATSENTMPEVKIAVEPANPHVRH